MKTVSNQPQEWKLVSLRERPTPERIITRWQRFSSGHWHMPKGDICAAYSGQTLPRVSVFRHEGRMFTTGGILFLGTVHAEATSYPLLPVGSYARPDSCPYSYEGHMVSHQGKAFRLGPKIVFVASEPTVEEWRKLMRVLYAHETRRSAQCTYLEFVDEGLSSQSENAQTARFKELAECGTGRMPRTQEEMHRLLDLEGGIENIAAQPKQVELAL